MNFETMLQRIAIMKDSLATCAIEGNTIAEKHLETIEGMFLNEQYIYLSKVFNNLGGGE